jgi:hypothetical protein
LTDCKLQTLDATGPAIENSMSTRQRELVIIYAITVMACFEKALTTPFATSTALICWVHFLGGKFQNFDDDAGRDESEENDRDEAKAGFEMS